LSEGNEADEEDGTAEANAEAAATADADDKDTASTYVKPVKNSKKALDARKARGKAARKNSNKGKKQKSRLMIAGAMAAISQGTFPVGGYCKRTNTKHKDCMTVSNPS